MPIYTNNPYDDGFFPMGPSLRSSIGIGPKVTKAIDAATKDWLDKHPEATTTVEDDSLTNAKFMDGSVNSRVIENESITTNDIADLAVTTPKIANNSITADKVASSAADGLRIMSTIQLGVAKVGAGLAMNGQALELDGNGDIATAVTSWLNAHPEATTTVQDGAITDAKLVQTGGVLSELDHFRAQVADNTEWHEIDQDSSYLTIDNSCYYGSSGRSENSGWTSYLFTPEETLSVFDVSHSDVLVMYSVYNGAPSASTFVAIYRSDQSSLPTTDNPLKIKHGHTLAISVNKMGSIELVMAHNGLFEGYALNELVMLNDSQIEQTGVSYIGTTTSPFEKMTKDYSGNTRFDGVAGSTGLVENSAYRTWYFTATRDFEAYFDDDGYVSDYVSICSYSGVPSASTFLARYRLSDENLPTVDNKASFLAGQVVAITINAGAAYSYTLMQNMTSGIKFYLSDSVILGSNQIDQVKRLAKATKSGNGFDIYLPLKRGQGYAYFNLRRHVSSSINEDTWRLFKFCITEEDYSQLWTPQQDIEWEGVVKESGTSDFIGGYHGDENFVTASIMMDGAEVDLTEDFELRTFSEMEIVVTSLVNRCDTPDDNLFRRYKVLKFAENQMTVENRWVALQAVVFERVYMSMLSIVNYEQAAKYCRNDDSWAIQSTTDTTPVDGSPYNGSTYAKMIEFWGDSFMARATILDNNFADITTANPPTNMFVSTAQTNTAKMYFESRWQSSVASGDDIRCKTLYEFV